MPVLLAAVLAVVPMHLGALHPVEQALTFALAFGPFLVLGVVVWVRRRQEARADRSTDGEPPAGGRGASSSERHETR